MKKKNMLLVILGGALAAAATIFLVKKNKNVQEGKPPKKAPQLPISNPGEQSEFTTAASESDLG